MVQFNTIDTYIYTQYKAGRSSNSSDYRIVFELRTRIDAKETELKECCNESQHIGKFDKTVVNYVAVQCPEPGHDDRAQYEGEGEGLRAAGPQYVLDIGQRANAVGHTQRRSEESYSVLSSAQGFLVHYVGLYQHYQQEGEEHLLAGLDPRRGVVIEAEGVQRIQTEPGTVDCLQVVVGDESAVVEPDEGHDDSNQEGHARGLARGLFSVKAKAELDPGQELYYGEHCCTLPHKVLPLVKRHILYDKYLQLSEKLNKYYISLKRTAKSRISDVMT